VMRIELIGPVLILAVMTTAFLARLPLPGYRPAIVACGGALAFLPVGSTTVGAFILAVVGPASAATIVLCLIYLQSALVGPRKPCLPTRAFLLCLVVTSVVFYPLTFGLTTFDPYDLGYRGGAVPGLMFAYLLIGWVARASDIPCWIGLAALLYLLDANGSSNLWDYLLFPLDTIVASFCFLFLRSSRTRYAEPARQKGSPRPQRCR
jgi:hypothetical protein